MKKYAERILYTVFIFVLFMGVSSLGLLTVKKKFVTAPEQNMAMDERVLSDEAHSANDEIALATTAEFDYITALSSSSHRNSESNVNTEVINYRVQKGETLMQIGFKFYSDYRKWKDIYQWNKKTLGGSPDIEGKPLLTLRGPFRRYQAPLGSPYLIKPGDNLGEISMKVYGTSKKWQSIWHLNKRQIRYPDLIFSGFTLYYDTEQELAAGH